MNYQDFHNVAEQEFWNFFKDKEYTKEQGEVFHSEYYVVGGEKVGYMETSSWGAPDEYRLKYPNLTMFRSKRSNTNGDPFSKY